MGIASVVVPGEPVEGAQQAVQRHHLTETRVEVFNLVNDALRCDDVLRACDLHWSAVEAVVADMRTLACCQIGGKLHAFLFFLYTVG